jgi:cytoskeletal protein RodZ
MVPSRETITRMTECVLPLTGSNPRPLLLLATLAMATGVALVIAVRNRGVRSSAALVIAFALAAAALVVGDARSADAQTCEPATTVAPTEAPTTVAPTTTAGATSTTASTTTTIATTTTAPTPTATPSPTTPTTAATTTTVAAPDLTPTIDGPQELELFDDEALYTVNITNLGTAPTDGSTMMFTVTLPVSVGDATLDVLGDPSTAEWVVTKDPTAPFTLTFTSTDGFVIPATMTSSVTLLIEYNSDAPGQFSLDVTLPDLIGGETNSANNTATHPVEVIELGPPG